MVQPTKHAEQERGYNTLMLMPALMRAQPGDLLGPPVFPRVADSDLTESDTDTKKLKGTGDGSEVKAEKLRKPSEVAEPGSVRSLCPYPALSHLLRVPLRT